MDSRLQRIRNPYCTLLVLLVLVKILAARLNDAERTPGLQALISVQQLVFVFLSLTLIVVYLFRKSVAWISR